MFSFMRYHEDDVCGGTIDMAGSGQTVVVPEQEEQGSYRQLGQVLAQPTPLVIGGDGTTAEIPTALLRMVRELAHILATNRVAILTSASKDLTTQQAADLLSISRPTLVRLLEEEHAIPFTRVGSHRRVRFADLLAYRQRRYHQQRRDMADLTVLGEEMGGYDTPVEPEVVLPSVSR
jgi:excisionase family DNA binding protein